MTDRSITYDKSLVGKTVRLIKINDKFTTLRTGDTGTVIDVDFVGKTFHQVWIKWNTEPQHTLALIPESNDQFQII